MASNLRGLGSMIWGGISGAVRQIAARYMVEVLRETRIFKVPAEDRVFTIPAEDRIFKVPSE